MDTKELRIGNYINVISAPKPYDSELGLMECAGYALYLLSTKEDIKAEGVPLTKEWFNNFGFKDRYNRNWFKIKEGKAYYVVNRNQFILVYESKCFVLAENIKYVHQLQNIYFSLRGKELEYKP